MRVMNNELWDDIMEIMEIGLLLEEKATISTIQEEFSSQKNEPVFCQLRTE